MKRLARWTTAIERLQWPLFVTLTIPNSEDPDQLIFLKKAWAKFRRRKIIASRVTGGVATFEVTNKGQGWHPHIHAILDCRWLAVHVPEPRPQESAAVKAQKCELAQKELSAAWADQIGEEKAIVWVRRVYGNGVVREILKYAVKCDELLESPVPIAPMLRVIRQTRMLSGFGSLHPLPSPDEEENGSVTCAICGEEHSFMPSDLVSFLMPPASPASRTRSLPPSKQQ